LARERALAKNDKVPNANFQLLLMKDGFVRFPISKLAPGRKPRDERPPTKRTKKRRRRDFDRINGINRIWNR